MCVVPRQRLPWCRLIQQARFLPYIALANGPCAHVTAVGVHIGINCPCMHPLPRSAHEPCRAHIPAAREPVAAARPASGRACVVLGQPALRHGGPGPRPCRKVRQVGMKQAAEMAGVNVAHYKQQQSLEALAL